MPVALLAEEISCFISEGRFVEMKAKGFSMLPFIKGGEDSIVLGPVGDVQIGDILLCKTLRNGYVIHRVVDINADTLVLMGDGNIKGKECCRSEDVVAKVVRIIGRRGVIECDSLYFRFLSFLWRVLRPVRRVLLRIVN